MKKLLVLLIIPIIFLTGCMMQNTPSDATKEFLSKYKNNDSEVVEELNEYLSTQDLDESELEDYREIYLRQYSNLSYKIKSEVINGDKSVVSVEITVFDYYKSNKDVGDYFTANQADFVNDDGDVDFTKYFAYKIQMLLETTDKVTYTIDINLTKNSNGNWEVQELTNEELSKLHGTYEY